jgi:preprotein translocase subunit SecD
MRRCPLLFCAALLASLAAVAACTPTPAPHSAQTRPTAMPTRPRTLAHDGGIRLTLRASCPTSTPACDLAGMLPNTLAILRLRAAEGLGVRDAVVRQQNGGEIVVELPADRDVQAAVTTITALGHVAFLATGRSSLPLGLDLSARTCTDSCAPGQYPVEFSSEQVDPASVSASVDSVTGQGYVILAFAGDNQTRFANYTHTHLGQYLTVTRDGAVIESAIIADIVPGPTEITGLPNLQAAQSLASYLTGGSLPLALRVENESLLTSRTG